MTTQIQLHGRTEEMHDDMLLSEGVMGGPLAQLVSSQDYMNEFHDLLSDADSHVVGTDDTEYPRRVRDLFDAPVSVDETVIEQARAVVENHDGDRDLLDWLDDHRDTEVFAISW